MATVDKTGHAYPGNFHVQAESLKGQTWSKTRYVDTVAENIAAADVHDIMVIDAGVLVTGVIITVVGTQATVTLGIGDSAAATQYHAALAVATLNATTRSAIAAAKYYAAANKIRITPSALINTAKFYVTVKGIRLV
jgi:hypothetical protein